MNVADVQSALEALSSSGSSRSAGSVPSQACARSTPQQLCVCSVSGQPLSPSRRTEQFCVPDHQEQIVELRRRFLAFRAKMITLWIGRLVLFCSFLEYQIMALQKEVRLGEDARCTAGLRDPTRLVESVASIRAASSSTMRLTVDQGECHHAASTLRFDIFHAVARRTGDPDVYIANWLEERAVPGGHFPVRASVSAHGRGTHCRFGCLLPETRAGRDLRQF